MNTQVDLFYTQSQGSVVTNIWSTNIETSKNENDTIKSMKFLIDTKPATNPVKPLSDVRV